MTEQQHTSGRHKWHCMTHLHQHVCTVATHQQSELLCWQKHGLFNIGTPPKTGTKLPAKMVAQHIVSNDNSLFISPYSAAATPLETLATQDTK